MNSPEPQNDEMDSQFRCSPFFYGLLGNFLLYACLPPLGWSWAAWVAPAFWFPLIAAKKLQFRGKTTKRIYLSLYFSHSLCWLALLQGMRLAHWTTYFGWCALSFYLGIYLPLFIFAARTLYHRLRLPIAYAGAIGWVCVEWIRGYVISGFSMGSLSHSQVDHLWLLQIADLGGGFAISFVLLLGAGILYQITNVVSAKLRDVQQVLPRHVSLRPLIAEGGIFALILIACYAYGQQSLAKFDSKFDSETTQDATTVSVGLIQGVTYTEFELPYEAHLKKEQEKQKTYNHQSIRALGDETGLDLLVWPESMYPVGPLLLTDGEVLHVPSQPEEVSRDQEQVRQWASRVESSQRQQHQSLLQYLNGNQDETGLGKAMLIGGTSAVDLTRPNTPTYNTAVLVSPDGNVLNMYHKNHLVMFGEYIPFGEFLPSLYNLLPIAALAPGKQDLQFDIADVKFSPNICFESTVPHRIRNMIYATDADGRRPDVMLNLTNDGWFWGSSMLDLHLRCNIMRSVELRRPNLIAANTGISGWIGPTGELLSKVEKKQAGYVIAKVGRSSTDSIYLLYGDIFAACCGLITLISLGKTVLSSPSD